MILGILIVITYAVVTLGTLGLCTVAVTVTQSEENER